MNRRRAIRAIKAAGEDGTVHVSEHAKDNDENVMVEDIQNALATAGQSDRVDDVLNEVNRC